MNGGQRGERVWGGQRPDRKEASRVQMRLPGCSVVPYLWCCADRHRAGKHLRGACLGVAAIGAAAGAARGEEANGMCQLGTLNFSPCAAKRWTGWTPARIAAARLPILRDHVHGDATRTAARPQALIGAKAAKANLDVVCPPSSTGYGPTGQAGRGDRPTCALADYYVRNDRCSMLRHRLIMRAQNLELELRAVVLPGRAAGWAGRVRL